MFDSGGGGGGLIGGAASSGLSFLASKQAYNRAKKMYKSRYQWTMEDMRKAGLNPILAYQQGVGSPGTANMTKIPDLAAGMAGMGQAGTAEKRRKDERGRITSEASLRAAGVATARTQAQLNTQLAKESRFRQATERRRAVLVEGQGRHEFLALPKARAVGEFYDSAIGRKAAMIGAGGSDASQAIRAILPFRRGGRR